ncbi:TPA: DUF2812 domain-containing protein [Bacillus pseudomycoides]|nr:DUF2812 domain-containing protein [Bacillus pseudomycoides]
MKKSYRLSSGLAFAEQKDLQMLQQRAQKGWRVVSFKAGLYTFEQAKPEDVIFNFDFQDVPDTEFSEYMNLFEESGWMHVSSHAGIHLFKAPMGTTPIYTDTSTKKSRNEQLCRPIQWLTLWVFIFTVVMGQLATWTGLSILTSLFYVSFVLLTPMTCTWIALLIQKRKLRLEGANE